MSKETRPTHACIPVEQFQALAQHCQKNLTWEHANPIIQILQAAKMAKLDEPEPDKKAPSKKK